mgnify:CR=1 FL=1
MIVRAEAPDDAAEIRRVTEAAFGGAREADLVEALRAGGHMALSLLALDASEVIGHALFSPLVSPASALALAPVSVAPDRQREGIGSRLIRFGLEMMREDGWEAVFVLGDPAYYGRFGFRREMAAPFETAYPREYFMALELRPGVLAGMGGAVVYPAPFLALA